MTRDELLDALHPTELSNDVIAEIAALYDDAQRYRLIRNPPPKGDALCAWSTTESGVLSVRGKHDGPIDGKRLDAELDAARTQ